MQGLGCSSQATSSGERKTWWIGASACFESVHDVTNYNLMLLSFGSGLGFRVQGLGFVKP